MTQEEKPKKESWDERRKREAAEMTFAEKVRTVAVDKTSLKSKE